MRILRALSAAGGFAAGLFLMGEALGAQDAKDKEYPHAFPRKGVTQILDNTRVTVWEVNWRHGDEQPYHRHRYDMAGVYLRYGPIVVTALDGSRNSVTTLAFEKSVSKRSACTKVARSADTLASAALRRDSSTMSGLYSMPKERAPRLAAVITVRPSPDPRS